MNNSLRTECKMTYALSEETQQIFLVGKKAIQRGIVFIIAMIWKKRGCSVSYSLKDLRFIDKQSFI